MLKRAFVETPGGQLHYCFEGSGNPIVLLHSTQRSVDEYAEMIPLLAKKRMAIAMDHVGCGDSFKPRAQPSIQDYAGPLIQLLDALGIERVNVMGHLLGAYVGVELAAAHPERIDKLVLSGLGWVDKENEHRWKTDSSNGL